MSEAEPTLHQTIEDLTTQAVQLGRDRFGIALDFSLTSLPKLGKLLDQARDSYLAGNVSEQGLDRTVLVWGAYLGETQRRNKGGSWKTDPTKTGDRRIYLFTKRINIYPFEQVRQKITGIEPEMPDRDEPPISPEQDKKKYHSPADHFDRCRDDRVFDSGSHRGIAGQPTQRVNRKGPTAGHV